VIRRLRTKLVGNVARIGRKRNTYMAVVWKLEVKKLPGKFRRRWNYNFKMNIK
jgi:hypothetical protein